MADARAVTQLLIAATDGDADASDALMALVYADLRRQAQAALRKEKPGHTLQPTALVHEAWLRLIGHDRMNWQNRAHFFAMAATLMRRLLVDHARKKNAARRGGGAPKISLSDGLGLSTDNPTDVLELHDTITRLKAMDPVLSEIVVLRFFGGLSVGEVAAVLDVSTRTVEREWAVARAWLRKELVGS